MRYLIEGRELTAYGMSNAIARASQDVENYERSTDLERLGGSVIELPKVEWERMSA